VRYDSANATQNVLPRRIFCDFTLLATQNALSSETLTDEKCIADSAA